jgi:hypothetical protein
VSSDLPRFQLPWWLKNQGISFSTQKLVFLPKNLFSTHFRPKTPIRHCMSRNKLIYDIKNSKNHPKNQNQPEFKNQPKLKFVFS